MWLVLSAGVLLLLHPLHAASRGDDLPLAAQLIWGTDGEKPADKNLKDVDPATRDKLKGVFRWRSYYEVGRQEFSVRASDRQRVRMSPKCEIEVENFGKSSVEVKLFGEGKLVVTRRQILKQGELFVVGGDDKNDTAWFVIITLTKR